MNNDFNESNQGAANQAAPPAKKSKLIWILPIGCLGILLCCGGGFGLLGFWGYNLAYNNDGYNTAINAIQESAQVQKLVGSPVVIQRNMDVKTENEGATTRFIYGDTFSGPNGSGTAEIAVLMDNATREFTTESITVEIDGETINLTDEGDFSLDIDDSGE